MNSLFYLTLRVTSEWFPKQILPRHRAVENATYGVNVTTSTRNMRRGVFFLARHKAVRISSGKEGLS